LLLLLILELLLLLLQQLLLLFLFIDKSLMLCLLFGHLLPIDFLILFNFDLRLFDLPLGLHLHLPLRLLEPLLLASHLLELALARIAALLLRIRHLCFECLPLLAVLSLQRAHPLLCDLLSVKQLSLLDLVIFHQKLLLVRQFLLLTLYF
jgi:hypothetical protein